MRYLNRAAHLSPDGKIVYSRSTIVDPTSPMTPDDATVQALRTDLALQISRCLTRRELTQVEAARRFDIPQPTLSKIVNGRVADLSLELLIRIAVRAGPARPDAPPPLLGR